MKKIFISLAVLVCAGALAPLFANDQGGDGAYIPNYDELVREGYGPHRTTVQVDYDSPRFIKAMPKPTQAYYGKGFVVYYGYTVVPVWEGDEATRYAFGHPLSYYKGLMANSGDPVDLTNYAVEIRKNNYQPGNFIAQRPAFRATPITRVQSVLPPTGTSTARSANGVLPPIGEKPQ